MRWRVLIHLGLTCLLCSSSFTALAQSSVYGSLAGRIVDQSRAPIPGVTITLTNRDTSETHVTVSVDDGSYAFPRVARGTFTLKAELQGFRTFVDDAVVLTVNEQGTLDITLRVGDVAETVHVSRECPVVQARSAEVSLLVDERRTRELPLNGKNFAQLMLLAPGTAGPATSVAVSGSRAAANTFTIDGANASDERSISGISIGGGASAFDAGSNLVSTEAIQEFRIITSNADATFGRGSGGQVNVVTKSGTNRVRGSGYEYYRDGAMDARDFFNHGPFFDDDGRAKVPPFRQHLAGGTLGGPLKRDRHFAFGSYERVQQRRQQTGSATIPNADLIDVIPGDLGLLFRTFLIERDIVPRSGNPAGQFSPLTPANRAAAVAAGHPARLFDGDSANGEAGTVLISGAPQRDVRQDALFVRTDHVLTNRWRLSLRYGDTDAERVAGSVLGPVDIGQNTARWQSGLGELLFTADSNQILEVRAGLVHARSVSGMVGGIDRRLTAIGVNPDYGIVITMPGTGLSNLNSADHTGFIDDQALPQISLLHTWTRGRTTLRSGLDVRPLIIDVANTAGAQPSYVFNGYVGTSGILGDHVGQAHAVSASASSTVFGPTGAMRHWRSTQQEYFAQLDGRLRPTVTLNAGLRYSYFGVYTETDHLVSNLFAVDEDGAVVPDVHPFEFGRTSNVLATLSGDRTFYQPDRNNWQPRIGAAWNIGGRGTTIVRGSYGLFVDRLYNLVFSGNVTNAPHVVSSALSFAPFSLAAAPVNAQLSQVTAVDPTLVNPYTHRFNVSVERSLGDRATVTAAYVGSRARKLIRTLEPNGSGAVPQALRPDPRFTDQRLIGNYSSANYDALQVYANRRLGGGVDFTAAYTFAHLKDDNALDRVFGRVPSLVNLGASADAGFQGGGAAWTERPRRADYSWSDLDIRHTVAFSHLMELPFGRGRRIQGDAGRWVNAIIGGWSLAGVVVFRSGEPFSITLGRDVDDDGDASRDRPRLVVGTLDDLYMSGGERTQHVASQADAAARLGIPQDVSDPFAAMPRNLFRAPGVRFYDLSLMKRIVWSRLTINAELNAFNVFNWANFAAPVSSLSDARFGRIVQTRTGTNPRQLQLGLRMMF